MLPSCTILPYTTLFRSSTGAPKGESTMPLFTAILTYGEDAARRQEIRPSHREYQRGLLEQGKLYKAGPFADDSGDRKSTRLNSSHVKISYAVFCLRKNR